MKEFIDKLIERFEEVRHDNPMITRNYILRKDAISIANELAEEYKGEELKKSQKIYGFIKREINPYGKPFEGTVYEFGLKVMKYIENLHTEEYNKDCCEWKQYDENDIYYTGCEQIHMFIDGSPTDNKYEFCPYCGKKIKVAPYTEGE